MTHREELLQAFRISVEDLAANRAGRLGMTQRRNLLWSGTLNLLIALLLGALLIAVLYAVAEKPLAPIQWILAGGLLVAVLILGLRYFQQTRAAVSADRVECVCGAIRMSRRNRGFYANIADHAYRIPIFPRYIRPDMSYRVYIVRQTESVVAVEPA